ncbi:MAG: hypothetical protein QHH75_11310 [Bacillota bacterium]|nr:hypothetical protein [Bacillota bacterium]
MISVAFPSLTSSIAGLLGDTFEAVRGRSEESLSNFQRTLKKNKKRPFSDKTGVFEFLNRELHTFF